jgi:dynein heavy chain
VKLVNEAKDNVKYMTSIERFWDPLYRCDPPEIAESLPSLMEAIRSVFHSSNFYTSSERITGFLSNVTNQIIIASQSFLTNRFKESIWKQNLRKVFTKIEVNSCFFEKTRPYYLEKFHSQTCKKLHRTYKEIYYKTTKMMGENADENVWDCSDVAIFGRLETFNTRLNKIKEILEIIIRYQIIDYIKISGMEEFSDKIKKAFQVISQKKYDPLAHRYGQRNEYMN